MNMVIRKATSDDIPEISRLAAEIWWAVYPDIITNEQIEFMLDKMYSASSLLQQLESGHQFFIAEENHKPVGYYSFSEKETGKYFLHKLYIKTNVHRKGSGHILVNHLVNSLPANSELRLTVNRRNYKAINFYFKNGFVIEEVADFDIGNGFFMEDFVMIKKVNEQQT